MNIPKIKVTNILAKTAGAVGLSLVAYDAHVNGTIKSKDLEKEHKSESLADRYLGELKLDSPSVVKRDVKKSIFKYMLDEDLSGFFVGCAGYCKGVASMLSSNVVPFVLSLGALFGGKLSGKGIVSKCSALGLIAYAGIFFAQELLGIGKSE